MTKRKNYDTTLDAVGSSCSDAEMILQQQQQQQQQQRPSSQQQKKKKPKTFKIETEVDEIIAVDEDAVMDTEQNNDNNIEGCGVTLIVQKKKKKLRRVDFDAVDENELLGTTIHGTSSITPNPANISSTTAAIVAATSSSIFEDIRPTTLRLTDKGGYLHTKQSRMKISQANQGKSPWNKGKERTLTAKAKISAGVRARNNEILQARLQILQITEEEWFMKKRQIKLLRERVRKAKIAAKNCLIEQQQLNELQAQLQIENTSTGKQLTLEQKIDRGVSMDHIDVPVAANEPVDDNHIQIVDRPRETIEPEETVPQQQLLPPSQQQNQDIVVDHDPRTSSKFRNISMFQRDIEWTPHRLDTDNYDSICPNNGPGGLICCQYCMAQYTRYMTSTIQDLQRHTTIKLGNEVDELYQHVLDTKQQLIQTIKVTRRKPIPIRQQSLTTNTKKVQQPLIKTSKPKTLLQNGTTGSSNSNHNNTIDTTGPLKKNTPVVATAATSEFVVESTGSIIDFSDELELSNTDCLKAASDNDIPPTTMLNFQNQDITTSEVYEI